MQATSPNAIVDFVSDFTHLGRVPSVLRRYKDGVPIWRAPALEAIIGGPLDGVGLIESAVANLVAQGAREGDQLEFKVRPHLPETGAIPANPSSGGAADWSAQQEWAKDVCQFANHQGGLLLVGVEEVDEVATGLNPTVHDAAALEQRLRAVLANYTAPTPLIDVVAIPASGGNSYMAIVVPPSGRAPHAVTSGPGANRRTLSFPVRDGSHTRWMTESEVADRYRQRSLNRSASDIGLRATVRAGAEQLGLASGLWLYVATCPESPAIGQLDQATVNEIQRWRDAYQFASPFGRTLYVNHLGFPAPSRVTFTGQDRHVLEGQENTDPRLGYLELYADGRAFAAKPVTFDTATDAEPGQVGLMTLIDDTVLTVDVALCWSSHQAGSWGSATLEAGLMDGGEQELDYATPLTLHSDSGGALRRLANTRLVRRPIRATVSVDLATCETQRGRMVAIHDTASALLQHFGVAETDMIEGDGTLIGGNWGWARRREIERWASERDIPYRD